MLNIKKLKILKIYNKRNCNFIFYRTQNNHIRGVIKKFVDCPYKIKTT